MCCLHKKLDLMYSTFPTSHLEGVTIFLHLFVAPYLPYSRYFVACRGGTAASSSQSPCRGTTIDVCCWLLANSRQLLLVSHLTVAQCHLNYKATKGRLTFLHHSVLLSRICRLLLLGCPVLVACPPQNVTFRGNFCNIFAAPGSLFYRVPV